jgi:hypothetical protein
LTFPNVSINDSTPLSQSDTEAMQLSIFIILIIGFDWSGAFSIINDERAILLLEKYMLQDEQQKFQEENNGVVENPLNVIDKNERVKRKSENNKREIEEDEKFLKKTDNYGHQYGGL